MLQHKTNKCAIFMSYRLVDSVSGAYFQTVVTYKASVARK